MTGKVGTVLTLVALFVTLAFAAQQSPPIDKPSIGIAIGQKMPPFTAVDQLGHDVSSDTLIGQNGTVLLFFRSADW